MNIEQLPIQEQELFEKESFIKESREFITHLKEKYTDILDKKFMYWPAGGKASHKIFMPSNYLEKNSEPYTIETNDEQQLDTIIKMIGQEGGAELILDMTSTSEDISFDEYLKRAEKIVNAFEQDQ